MADIFSKQKRSSVMAAVKAKGSVIEKRVAQALKHAGLRMKKHSASLPGKPDFSSSKLKLAVFVDSCFWHGCRYHGSIPKSSRSFWVKKIARNKERDREVNRALRAKGWRVVRIWEHSLRASNPEEVDLALLVLFKGW